MNQLHTMITKRRIWILTSLAILIGLLAIVAATVSPFKQASTGLFSEQSNQQTEYLRATVLSIDTETSTVKYVDGPRAGTIERVPIPALANQVHREQPGDTIVVANGQRSNSVFDKWRLPQLLLLVAVFFVAIVVIGRKKGIMGTVGLGISIGIIGLYVVPRILDGASSFWTIVGAAYAIAVVSLYIAHGFHRRTTIALVATLLVLSIVVGLAVFSGWFVGLTGSYDETTALLSISTQNIDMRGVLVGGMIIATLGVLDDIVTAQVAVVDQLRKANPRLGVRELYKRGSAVGGEHIAALINTLALAYVGVSLPVILSIVGSQYSYSIPVLFNGEFIAQEVTRTIVSSLGLLVAVPISTLLAAVALCHWQQITDILKTRLRHK
ncbi:MAG: YibE/F family protein [Chloroflexi bacterium]|nr:MAG: YibE/F family protein [Chloroflexota bacterium]